MANGNEIPQLRDQCKAGRPEIDRRELDADEAQHEPQQRMHSTPAERPIPLRAFCLVPKNPGRSETGGESRAHLVLALAQSLNYAVHDAGVGLVVLVEFPAA